MFAIFPTATSSLLLTQAPDSEVDVLGTGLAAYQKAWYSIRADGWRRRSLARHDVKGDSEENRRIGEQN